MKNCILITVLVLSGVWALDWVNTGDLTRAELTMTLTQSPDGRLYAGSTIDTAANDSGWVYHSTDLVNWERCGDIPGDQNGVYCLLEIRDTLWAGSSTWTGTDWLPLVYRSADKGETWTALGPIPTPVSGTFVWALVEMPDQSLVAGVNWLSFHSSSMPARSTDRGQSWSIGVNGSSHRPVSEFCLLRASDGNLFVGTWATQRRLCYVSSDNGQNWRETDTMFDSGQCRALEEGPAGLLFAGTYPKTVPQENVGRVFRSSNDGTTWQEVGYGHLNRTTGIRCLRCARDGRLYAGTIPSGVVFVSEDSGNTWTSAGLLPGASAVYCLIEVTDGDSAYLYAGTGPNGDVFRARLGPPVGLDGCSARAGPDASFEVYPNPTRGDVTLSRRLRAGCPNRVPRPDDGRFDRCELYDAHGTKKAELGERSGTLRLPGALPAGVYYLRFTEDDRTYTTRLLRLE